jgi:hypothetical protein
MSSNAWPLPSSRVPTRIGRTRSEVRQDIFSTGSCRSQLLRTSGITRRYPTDISILGYDIHIAIKEKERLADGRSVGVQADLRRVSFLYPEASRFLLRIHALLCEALHAFGAGKQLIKEWEQFRVLAEHGRDAELLLLNFH